jgi:hypothetical protein
MYPSLSFQYIADYCSDCEEKNVPKESGNAVTTFERVIRLGIISDSGSNSSPLLCLYVSVFNFFSYVLSLEFMFVANIGATSAVPFCSLFRYYTV